VRDARARPTAAEVERLLRHGLEAMGSKANDLAAPRRVATDHNAGLELSATVWGPSEDLTPPQSFQLGSNAVAMAAPKALPSHPGAFWGRDDVQKHLSSVLRAGTPTV